MGVRGILAAVCVAVGLAACGLIRKEQLNEQYSSFVGKPISEAIIQFGPPSGQFDVSRTERAFQWDKRGINQSPATANRVYGTVIVNPSQITETRCLFTFVARGPAQNTDMSQWIIYRWQWNASDVRTC